MRKHVTLAALVALAAATALYATRDRAEPGTRAPSAPTPTGSPSTASSTTRTTPPPPLRARPVATVEAPPSAPPATFTAPPVAAPPRDIVEAHAHLASRLDAQSDDPEWGRATEVAIADVIDTNAEGSRLTGVDCRTDLCRIEVEHDSQSTQLAFLSRVLPFAPFDAAGSAQRVDDTHTVIYLGRLGHDFPL
jgi:hypothetical protein